MANDAKPHAHLSGGSVLATDVLPEISMGFLTKEEVDDIGDNKVFSHGKPQDVKSKKEKMKSSKSKRDSMP